MSNESEMREIQEKLLKQRAVEVQVRAVEREKTVQGVVDKFYADRSISGKELLDVLHTLGLIPKPVPTPKPPVKK